MATGRNKAQDQKLRAFMLSHRIDISLFIKKYHTMNSFNSDQAG
ncbi:Uncharacterized protein dnm_024000 [Desulfonema magnum]|uniref:Uncharacterized protein n=1 Tax=Desulfonema magnum TaxID=45655 RepID=A0A975BJD4_9BACT|nr:Uncharacterized protein dnm_024000 [Desulfonema magnum]